MAGVEWPEPGGTEVHVVRYRTPDPGLPGPRLGALVGDQVVDLGAGDMRAFIEGGADSVDRARHAASSEQSERAPLDAVTILAPLPASPAATVAPPTPEPMMTMSGVVIAV